MIKNYFKNLLTIIIYLMSLVVLVFVFAFLMALLKISWYNPDYLLGNLIVVFVCFLIACVSIFIRRIKKCNNSPTNFRNYILDKLKSKDNLTAILAWQTILVPFQVVIAILENTPFLPLIVGTIILIIASTLLIEMINTIIWSIVFFAAKNNRIT